MKQTVNFFDFRDAFKQAGRQDQFSYNAQRALYEYLEDLDPDYDLDVIALCCEYVESTFDETKEELDLTHYSDDQLLDHLNERTIVISQNPLVYQAF